jgi:hypothetical protein
VVHDKKEYDEMGEISPPPLLEKDSGRSRKPGVIVFTIIAQHCFIYTFRISVRKLLKAVLM